MLAKPSLLLEQVLQPLTDPAPAGPDLRESTALNSFSTLQVVIKEDRRFQDKAGHEGTIANWIDVRRRATEILQQESKDLEVATWLVRALVKTDGFAGLPEGLALLCGLHARFAAELHPRDAELRRSRLEWLDQQLDSDLRAAIPLLDRSQSAQAATLAQTAKDLLAALAQTITELAAYYKDDPPSFSRTRRAIDFLASCVAEAGGEPTGEAAATGETLKGAAVPSALPGNGPRSREEALRMLEAVAAYFAAAEPLSPVPHLLRRAARWARGSLQQWLDEMVVKDDLLEVIYKTLDMAKPVPKQ